MEGTGGKYNEVKINLNRPVNPRMKTFAYKSPFGSKPRSAPTQEKVSDHNEESSRTSVQEAKALIEGGNCKRVRNQFLAMMGKPIKNKPAPKEKRVLVESAGPKEHVIVHDTSPRTIKVSPGVNHSPPTIDRGLNSPVNSQTNSIFFPINKKTSSSVTVPLRTLSNSGSDPDSSHTSSVSVPVSSHSNSERNHSNTVSMALGSQSNTINIPIKGMKNTGAPIPSISEGGTHTYKLDREEYEHVKNEGNDGVRDIPTLLSIRPQIQIDPKNQNTSGKLQPAPEKLKGVGSLTLPMVNPEGTQNNELQLKLSLSPSSPTSSKAAHAPWKTSYSRASPSQEVISVSSPSRSTEIKIFNGHVIDCSLTPSNRDKFGGQGLKSAQSRVPSDIIDLRTLAPPEEGEEEEEVENGQDIVKHKPAAKSSSTLFSLHGHRGEFKGRFHIFPPPTGFQDEAKVGPQSAHHFRFSPSINRRQPRRLETVPESLIIDLTTSTDTQLVDGQDQALANPSQGSAALPNVGGGEGETARWSITNGDKTSDYLYTSEVNVHVGHKSNHISPDQSQLRTSPDTSHFKHSALGNTYIGEQGGPCQDLPDEHPVRSIPNGTPGFMDNDIGSFSNDDIIVGGIPTQASTTVPITNRGLEAPCDSLSSSDYQEDAESDNSELELTPEEQYNRQRRASVRISAISDSGFQAWIQNEQSHKEKLNGHNLHGDDESSVPYMDKLKEMTSRLKLSPRRPSVVAWKQQVQERPQGPWNSGNQGGGDEVDSRNSLHDFGDVEDESEKTDWAEDRKNRVEEALDWLQRELLYMREQDQTLARTLITLRHEIQQVKLARSYAEHQETIDEVADELETERHLAGHADILPEHFPMHLKQCGVTKMNISSRRFSVF